MLTDDARCQRRFWAALAAVIAALCILGLAHVWLEPPSPVDGAFHSSPDISRLSLSAIMADSGAGYALLSEAQAGRRYFLRNGKFYDHARRPIPEISGSLDTAQKTVTLTQGQEVRVLRLGNPDSAPDKARFRR